MAATASQLKVKIPAETRKPCVPADLPPPPHPGEAEVRAFGVDQTGALDICDQRRALGVAAMDLHNQYVDLMFETLKPETTWERITGGRRVKAPPKPTLNEVLNQDWRK